MKGKLNRKLSKNDIAKSIIWLLIILILFILINLVIWASKYWGIGRYASLLDNKDWSTSISQTSITNPVAMFYDDTWLLDDKWNDNIEINTEIKLEVKQEQQENDFIENLPEAKPAIDPYDPEFEDEFNSFFWWENSELTTMENNNLYNSLNDEAENDEIWAIQNTANLDTQDQKHSIIQRLIQKFNE
jgi:hypothetical protein